VARRIFVKCAVINEPRTAAYIAVFDLWSW